MAEKREHLELISERNRLRLHSDCENCFGLCCVALPFAASSDFAVDKDGGTPCKNLQSDFRCHVHANLREIGYRGCTVYDCFGAGQKVSQVTFAGRSWRDHPASAKQMFEVFPIMRQLNELLWYLTEALALQATRPIHEDLREALQETERLTRLPSDDLQKSNVAGHRAQVNTLLLRTGELVRAEVRTLEPTPAGGNKSRSLHDTNHRGSNSRGSGVTGKNSRSTNQRGGNFRGADLIGKNFRNADLRGANFRGAYLIAADLRGADLCAADLIGADLRDADLRGANLSDSLFLTQFQINAARGDTDTQLPPLLTRPPHWSCAR
ncbi:pentapeptide repeat-containing protein [Tumebacillus flagellatus]|uniref:Oxetanocin A resistance protein n=1 Tax=Tumebacillus flagellatus TaxID=1157490 RepID=A0A074LV87_9BACL|nr:pentapeptide repeat-containing protein [Tumebacillus flagellatus]KEO83893.1 hypothetical protein EL26_06800 [Tumebacillus flagellatus]